MLKMALGTSAHVVNSTSPTSLILVLLQISKG
jgi:hypothetical protein